MFKVTLNCLTFVEGNQPLCSSSHRSSPKYTSSFALHPPPPPPPPQFTVCSVVVRTAFMSMYTQSLQQHQPVVSCELKRISNTMPSVTTSFRSFVRSLNIGWPLLTLMRSEVCTAHITVYNYAEQILYMYTVMDGSDALDYHHLFYTFMLMMSINRHHPPPPNANIRVRMVDLSSARDKSEMHAMS